MYGAAVLAAENTGHLYASDDAAHVPDVASPR